MACRWIDACKDLTCHQCLVTGARRSRQPESAKPYTLKSKTPLPIFQDLLDAWGQRGEGGGAALGVIKGRRCYGPCVLGLGGAEEPERLLLRGTDGGRSRGEHQVGEPRHEQGGSVSQPQERLHGSEGIHSLVAVEFRRGETVCRKRKPELRRRCSGCRGGPGGSGSSGISSRSRRK